MDPRPDTIRFRYGPHHRARQTGFNFTEVLFAVMILGIGFIMTAAIFPVAMLQTKTSQEETSGAGIARGGANYLDQLATDAVMEATDNDVVALDQNAAVYGSLLLPGDNRYAWIPFYRRAGDPADVNSWHPVAQVFMIPIAVRSRSVFDRGVPPVPQNAGGAATMTATIEDSTVAPEGVDMIEFPTGGGNDTNDNFMSVADGSYVIIAGEGTNDGTLPFRGRIYRIGNQVEGNVRRWELMVPSDFTPERTYDGPDADTVIDSDDPLVTGITAAPVFVVGRSLADPGVVYNAGTNPYEGGGQNVAAYTTFVSIR